MTADAKERDFRDDIIGEMLDGGWLLGEPGKYDRDLGRDPKALAPSFW